MLITADVSKCDAGDATAWHLLEIERSSTAGKNLHLVSTCPYQMNRSPRDKDFVLIDSWTDKDLVVLSCIE
jgi:hypothetical protein